MYGMVTGMVTGTVTGMVWYGMVWYVMVWYGMVWYVCVHTYIYIYYISQLFRCKYASLFLTLFTY